MCLRTFFPIALAFLTVACGKVTSGPVGTNGNSVREFETSNLRPKGPHPTAPAPVLTGSININTASADELQRLPHIGASMAEKIIGHREKHGPFKRPEELMLIQGMSDIRFRRIRHLVRVE